MQWEGPSAFSEDEKAVAKVLHRVGRFYVFLRETRHQLFDAAFQAELEQAYGKARGTTPVPPALLAMVTLLQAYDQVSDAEAVITARLDKRWQLVLGTLGSDKAPFSQGVLSQFRSRMIEHELDCKLLERTVQLAKETGKFGWQKLKVALDSSPLLGCGRVEDTWNLIGRALSTVVDCAAKTLNITREKLLTDAGLTLLSGKSLKSALDIDWDDEEQKAQAFKKLLNEVASLEVWVAQHAREEAGRPPLKEALEALRRVLAQDLEPDPNGGGRRIKEGVAKDRQPSLGDPEMRHGRKSRSKLFNGYKRHVATTAHGDLILEAVARPANEPEAQAAKPLLAAVGEHGAVEQLQIDRGYLAADEVEALRAAGTEIQCKPWPSRNRGLYSKEMFVIDLKRAVVICPAGESVAITGEGKSVHFHAESCGRCEQRPKCTRAKQGTGRSITLHPQEELLVELRAKRKTAAGRAALRERVHVEHSLARVGAIQGPRARYVGTRKNTFDLRRCASVANLQALARVSSTQLKAAA